jgi:glyoxylase-like metal-dependent hydrolase (beta-lactamase superfamily II)
MNIYPAISRDADNWDVIVMGHLRVNTCWGETYENPPRGDPSTCTSVMVRGRDETGKPYVLVIDPTMRWTPDDYYFDINRRTGLHKEDVTHCYCTHHHLDHYDGFKYFPNAEWLAPKAVAEILALEAKSIDGKRVKGVDGEFLPGVYALPLPGHTPSLCGAAFRCRGKRILAAGDSVMTKYHFDAGTTDFQKDPELLKKAAESIQNMKDSFDIVIPGHDNMIAL